MQCLDLEMCDKKRVVYALLRSVGEHARGERKRSQEAAAEKLFMAYGSRKKNSKYKKKISHCTWLFQFSLIPILRIDLSLQHCKVCAYQFFVIISLRTHSLSLTLVVCADEKMYANCCICISCISLNCIAFMQQHWQLISWKRKYRAYHLRNMRIDG